MHIQCFPTQVVLVVKSLNSIGIAAREVACPMSVQYVQMGFWIPLHQVSELSYHHTIVDISVSANGIKMQSLAHKFRSPHDHPFVVQFCFY